MSDKRLSERDADLLRRCTIMSDRIILPEQLSRADYESVNKVIVNLGGKWNRSRKAHLFAKDPRAMIEEALGTGKAVDQKKALQAFFTPPALAQRIAELADVRGHVVLEPSAGEGALAVACMNAGAKDVYCVEIESERAAALRALSFTTETMDFLDRKPSGVKFTRIVMNPPFSKNQDIAHVAHALKFLLPGGKLTAIMAANPTRKGFVALQAGVDCRYTYNEEGAFKESGTNVRTLTLEVWN